MRSLRYIGLGLVLAACADTCTAEPKSIHASAFRGGRLVEGGPVLFRGRAAALPGETPAVGAWARPPEGQALVAVEVDARTPSVGSALALLVDRVRVGEPQVVPKGGPHTLRFALDPLSHPGGHRLEVTAVRGRVGIERLEVLAEDGSGRDKEAVRPAKAVPTRVLLPRTPGTRLRYVDAAERSVELVVAGEVSTRGRKWVRVDRAGTDGYSLFSLPPGLGWAAHRNSGEIPVSFEDAPVPMAVGPYVLAGDEYEAVGRRRSTVLVTGRVAGVALRLRAEGKGPALDLAWEVDTLRGPVRIAGKLFGQEIDWRVASETPPPAPPPPPAPGDGDAAALARWDSWLARRGLDPFGRKSGAVRGGTIRLNYEPDLGGRTRLQWLRQFFGGEGPPAHLE
jgi:hypothetical protein